MKTIKRIMQFCYLAGATAMFAGAVISKIFILVAVIFYFTGMILDSISKIEV